jgi:hypothetical protein
MSVGSLVIICLVWGIIWSIIAALIGRARGGDAVGAFLIGALPGLIGVVLVALLPRRAPGAGWAQRVKCGHCGARQNSRIDGDHFDCWKCGAHHVLVADAWRLGLSAGPTTAAMPEGIRRAGTLRQV